MNKPLIIIGSIIVICLAIIYGVQRLIINIEKTDPYYNAALPHWTDDIYLVRACANGSYLYRSASTGRYVFAVSPYNKRRNDYYGGWMPANSDPRTLCS